MNETVPLLSICIPTYNRAELLKQCLESLAIEAKPFSNMVEIVVSNNCSNDHTSQAIVDYLKLENFNYHEQPRNTGATGNIDYLVRHLARGEFCWIIGDDDLLRIGAIAKVLSIIENNNYDFIFMNHSYEWNRDFNEIAEITHQKLDEIKSPLCSVCEDKVIERWEDIISLSETPALFTSIVSSIFRRNTWSHICLPEFNHLEERFPSLEATFPHTYILAKHNVGKPCYFIGFPYVAFFVGAQEWLEKWRFLLLKYVLELSDLFEILGARKCMVNRYREIIFKNSHHDYLNVLLGKYRSPKIFIKHLIKYCKYSEYWKMLVSNIKSNVNLRSNINKAIARLVYRILHSETYQNLERGSAVLNFKYLGKNSRLPAHLLIKNAQYISIGENFSALQNLRIEAWDEYLGDFFTPEILIGDNVYFNTDIHIDCINKIVIGNNVLMASRIYISDHSHGEISHEALSMPPKKRLLISKGEVVIGDNVWIGEGVSILPGVTIGENSIIGANSVVTKTVPANCVVAGNPAKLIKNLS